MRAQTLPAAQSILQSMNTQSGAKATALGGAFSSLADDTSALYWNPAGMAWDTSSQIQTTYNQWFLDTFFQDLGAVFPTSWGALGARVSYVNFGSFDNRNQFGSVQGSQTPQAWNGSLGGAVHWGKLALGLSLDAGEESFTDYGVSGFGADLGALYREKWGSFSAGVRDVGGANGYALPTEFYLGGSGILGSYNSQFHLLTDVTFPDGPVVFHHGLEWAYEQVVFLRVGFQWITQPLQTQDQAGFGGGMGVRLGDFQLDYSIVSYGDLGITNKAAVGYQFGATGTPSPTPVAARRKTTLVIPASAPTPFITPVSPATAAVVTPVPTESMKILYKEGISAYKAGKYKEAAMSLHQAVRISDASVEPFYYAEAYAMLGIIYQYHATFAEHLTAAAKYYHEALRREPTNETAKKHLKQLESAP